MTFLTMAGLLVYIFWCQMGLVSGRIQGGLAQWCAFLSALVATAIYFVLALR